MPVTIFPGNMKYKDNNGQYHDITGLQGETGPQGPVGPRGETGSQGPRGETGSAGPQGEPGAKGETGDTGTTFTPAVSSEGVISWTNDGGNTNPSPVNIKGPKGDKGDPGDATIDDTAGEGDVTKVWSANKSYEENQSLLSAINVLDVEETLLRSDLPGTTVAVTFDSDGNPATITHSANGSAVRTDVFTWGTDTVTEVRTASSKKITITTDLATLAQTVSEIEEVA